MTSALRLFHRPKDEGVSTTLRRHNQVGESPSAAVLTVTPLAQPPLSRTMAAADPPSALDEALAECFRTLRTQVLTRARCGLRSFVLASARPQEGKSTVAVNLAITLAASGRRVLLVDGDLRRPSLHRLLCVPNRIGLAELLSDSVPLAVATQPLSSGFSVLTSGRSVTDPQELLLNGTLETALAAMKGAFEIVLIDSAPILSVADSGLLAGHADGVIIVVRSGVPTTADVRLVRERLTTAGGSIIGCVLSHFTGPAAQNYHPYAYPQSE